MKPPPESRPPGPRDCLRTPGLAVGCDTCGAMLMERVRQLQFHALAARRDRGNLRHLFLMHLTKGLESEAINSLGQHGIDDHISSAPWFNHNQKWVEALKRGENKIELTRYEIARNLQRLLAGVRTDLDSFHQVEAYALFCSGYRMAFIDLAKVSAGLLTEQESRAPANNWRMGKIWPLLGDNSSGNAFVLRSLEVSQSRFFKAARRHTQQTAAVGGAVAVILSLVATFGRQPLYKMIVITFPVVAWGAALVVTGAGIIAVVRGLYQWKGFGPFIRIATQTFLQVVTGCVLPFALLGSRIHLTWIDSRYLKDGAFDTIDGRPGGARVLS